MQDLATQQSDYNVCLGLAVLLCFLVDVYTSGWLATPITMTSYRNWLPTSEVHKRRIHSAELAVAQCDTR